LGTGFLVGPNIFLTNYHVLPTPDLAQNCVVEFNYQKDWDGHLEPSQTFLLDPTKFMSNPKLDYTLCRVQGNPGAQYGYVDLSHIRTPAVNDYVSVIQHPYGGPKQLCLTDNKVSSVFGDYMQYTTDTEPGAWGSPVFDRQWNLVALHHKGGALPKDDGRYTWINQGVAMPKIVKDARTFLGIPDEVYSMSFDDLRSELTQMISHGVEYSKIQPLASTFTSRYPRFPIALYNWTQMSDFTPVVGAVACGVAVGAAIRHWARKSGHESIDKIQYTPTEFVIPPVFGTKISAFKGTPQVPSDVYGEVLRMAGEKPTMFDPIVGKFPRDYTTSECVPGMASMFLAGVMVGARAYDGVK
jgi:hypothetical protein